MLDEWHTLFGADVEKANDLYGRTRLREKDNYSKAFQKLRQAEMMRYGENSYFYRQTPEKVSFSAAAAQAMAAAGSVVRIDLGGPDKADPELEQIDQAGRSAKARRSRSLVALIRSGQSSRVQSHSVVFWSA